ncbi:MAG: rhomboid family intramembrane serine protease [Chitinophagaceae bacterium]|nr:MAG: rhomboid family intramembrane serine protease [Chitinophagaceae bacterium]
MRKIYQNSLDLLLAAPLASISLVLNQIAFMNFSDTPITILLIAANVIFSFIGFSNSQLIDKAIGWPYYSKRDNQYYRFISSGFLHADWMHLIFNMFTLYFFGSNLELYLKVFNLGGGLAYLALYFLGLIVADIPSYLKHNNDPKYRSLGASGAVSAVVFAVIVFSPWSSIYLYGALKISAAVYAVLYVIYCVYMGKQNSDNVNHDAHLWGSVFGLVFTLGLLLALKPGIMQPIMEELSNFSLFGRKAPGAVIEYLLLNR